MAFLTNLHRPWISWMNLVKKMCIFDFCPDCYGLDGCGLDGCGLYSIDEPGLLFLYQKQPSFRMEEFQNKSL